MVICDCKFNKSGDCLKGIPVVCRDKNITSAGSLMVKRKSPKLDIGVRFPSGTPN